MLTNLYLKSKDKIIFMKPIKCFKCGLIDFDTENICKKCKSPLSTNFNDSLSLSLGELEFRSSVSLMTKALMLIGGSLSLLVFVLAVFFKDSLPENDFLLTVLVMGIIPFLCCAYAAVNFLGAKKVEIYQNGLVYKQKSQKDIIFWGEVKNCVETVEWILVDNIPIGRGRVITLTTTTDNKFILGQEIGGLSKVRDLIRRKITVLS
jgi:hypothetical protein